jgi:isoleucyl-tRNA synthetase
VTAAEFREKCRAYADRQIDGQKTDFMRLGVLGEWDKPYKTMDFQSEADIIRVLGKIIDKGHLKKGFKPVHWCTDCGSALAEAEVEYQNKISPSLDVRFKVVPDQNFADAFSCVEGHQGTGDISVVIWTTTAWTLPANRAVCLSPELEYTLVQVEDEGKQERLVVATDLVTQCMDRFGVQKYHALGYCKGAALELMRVNHPFYDFNVPLILGTHVTTESGTGCVHTAPGHGVDDFNVGKQYGIEVANPVGANGVYVEGTPLFAGQHVFKVTNAIVDTLKDAGSLVHHESFEHSYPNCWRHKTPIIYRATPQWFIGMETNGLREMSLEQIRNTEWIPNWGEQRISTMVEGRPDWCISRQRTWGVPIALFIHKDSGDLHPKYLEHIEHIAKSVEQSGIQAWWDLDASELLGDDAVDYVKVQDTLDVWFDSGVTHYFVVDQRDEIPAAADLYLEGSDQHRGWFMSSLMTSVASNDKAPYKQVLTHGFTVDGDGKKMSKSLGNVVSPQTVMNKLGADILRLWVASTDYRSEMTVSDEILKRSADAYRRIRNTSRFLLSNLNGFDPATDLVALDELVSLDHWVISRAAQAQKTIIDAYEKYDFLTVTQTMMQFCSVDLGSFYLDIVKDRQYTAKAESHARRSCQTALYHIAEALVRWIAPITSFTAQEIWQTLPGERSDYVFTETWYEGLADIPTGLFDNDYWQNVMLVKTEVNKRIEQARRDGVVGGSLEVDVTVYATDALASQLARLEDELRFVLITSSAKVVAVEQAPDNAQATGLDNVWLHVGIARGTKCERCWHYREDVGQHQGHETLCDRCVSNVDGEGETRQYA